MSARRIILLAALMVLGALSATGTAAATTASYSGSVSATGTNWQFETLSVTGSGPLTETLTWSTSTAELLVGLSHKNSDGSWTWVAQSQGAQPVTLTTQVTPGTWRLAVEARSGASSYTLGVTYPNATPSTMPPEVTLIFSRTELSAADHSFGGESGSCTRDDRDVAPLDTVVAPYIAANYPHVHPVGSIETGPTSGAPGHWCPHSGKAYGSSWANLTTLRNLGWSFIDHSATYATNWPWLTQQQRYDQTCGSRDVITSHGLPGANGQFDWPNNSFDATVNTSFVRKCFSFSRGYGTGVTTAAQIALNNGQQSTRGVSGGHCNIGGLPCTTVNKVKAYTLPSAVIAQMHSLQPGQWQNLQTYLLVTGKNPTYATNATRWDCTNPDPRYHWTNDVERYCWNDMRTVLAALNADGSVKSNSPAGVATDWRLARPPQ
jgi:hypothetical protein